VRDSTAEEMETRLRRRARDANGASYAISLDASGVGVGVVVVESWLVVVVVSSSALLVGLASFGGVGGVVLNFRTGTSISLGLLRMDLDAAAAGSSRSTLSVRQHCLWWWFIGELVCQWRMDGDLVALWVVVVVRNAVVKH